MEGEFECATPFLWVVAAYLSTAPSAFRPDVIFDLVVPPARFHIVQQALSAGRRHVVIQNRRFLPGIRRAKALIDSGALGAVTAVHSDFFVARFLLRAAAEAVYCRDAIAMVAGMLMGQAPMRLVTRA